MSNERRSRTVVKSITWVATGFLMLLVISVVLYGTSYLYQITGVYCIYAAMRWLQYFVHDRVWSYIKWGYNNH